MKKFYTSNYARNGQHPMAVSISAYLPKWEFNGGWYKPLAPSKDLLHAILDGTIDAEEYDRRYLEELKSRTTPEKVVMDLKDGSILLCFEKPTDHCHRHIAREWLNASGLCKVEELYNEKELKEIAARTEPPNSLADLFY